MLHRWIFNRISRFVFQKFFSLSLWSLSRRPGTYTGGAFLLCFISFFCFQPSLAKVGSEEAVQREISQKIETFLTDLIGVANSREARDKKNIRIQKILQRDCDMDHIARGVLGESKWKQAKPKQRKAFTTAFTAYFSKKLRLILISLKGHRVSLGKIKKADEGHYVVPSLFKKAKSDTKSIELMVSKTKKEAPRVFDLSASGFSAISHENEKIRSRFIDSGKNLDVLIRNLVAP